jgi:uncharacterized protein
LNVPVLVHTGSGIPFSVPSLVIPRAREYPKVKIILSHSGFAILASDAWVTARECPNVYLETSWSIPNDVEWFNRTIGAERIMFGSDLPKNIPAEIAKYETIDLTPTERERCLSGTAAEVFRLPSK